MIADNNTDAKLSLVLSCGRTGTTLLHHLLSRGAPACNVLQEPKFSHSIHLLGNAADYGWPTRRAALKLFRRTRSAWLGHGHVVEINPFLSAIAALLPGDPLLDAVVHMVRHPFPWIASMLRFRGYGWRRHVTPFMPFVYGRAPVAADRWSSLNEAERFAYQWVRINLDIGRVLASGVRGRIVRFEDFVQDGCPAKELTLDIARHLELPTEDFAPALFAPTKPVNPSAATGERAWERWGESMLDRVWKITSPLAATYGYERDVR